MPEPNTEARSEMAQVEAKKKQRVKVTVDYLPATEDLKRDYEAETLVETVRTDAKSFFGVQDRQERDTYFYYLAYKGERIENTNVTLDDLVRGKSAHFSLVEQITAGVS
jgi:Ni,Fe-hydrogenase III component G